MKMNMNIKTATAHYTGGGIYIYFGELHDGTFFRTCDEWDSISICDADTSTEDADYCEFYEEHEIYSVEGDEFKREWDNLLDWIISHHPQGNYLPEDLERRFFK